MKIKINLISENYKVNSTARQTHTKLSFSVWYLCVGGVYVPVSECAWLCVSVCVINEVIGK